MDVTTARRGALASGLSFSCWIACAVSASCVDPRPLARRPAGVTDGGAGADAGRTGCVELRTSGGAVTVEVPGGGPPLARLDAQPIPGAGTRDLRAVWALSADDVHAAGHGILHWDGCRFVEEKDAGDYYTLWGIGSHRWVGGVVPRDCACCACAAEVSHFNGEVWSKLPTPEVVQGAFRAGGRVVSLWAAAPDEVWIALRENPPSRDFPPTSAVLRWNGSAWSTIVRSTRPGIDYSVIGRDRGEVYVSGGGVWRWDGNALSHISDKEDCSFSTGLAGSSLWLGKCRIDPDAPPFVTPFAGRWGAFIADVWTVGQQGSVRRFNGTGTLPIDSGTVAWIHGVWGTSVTDVWLVGDGGTILHYGP